MHFSGQLDDQEMLFLSKTIVFGDLSTLNALMIAYRWFASKYICFRIVLPKFGASVQSALWDALML